MAEDRSSAARVVVIEDEADLRNLLCYNLQAWGYEARAAESGEVGLKQIAEFAPQLVLLDVMLPDLSGIEVCRRIRALPGLTQPVVVMLTAKGDEMDRVVGFEVGADDYMVKPFSVRELMLRMTARLKARGTEPPPESPARKERAAAPTRRRLVAGSLEVDPDGHHVFVAGEEVSVSALEMRILVYLFDARGIVRTRHDMLTQVWGYQPDVNSRTVDTHVKRLRQKLGPAGVLIETVRGLGYRLAELDGDGPASKR